MADLTIVKSEPLPGPPPQASTGGELSVVKSEPVSKSFLDQVADYPKGIWENLVQTGQGMVNLATTDPRETIKGIGAAQDAVRLKLVDALKKGDYVTAGRHALEYLIPMAGPQMGEMGDLAQRGEVGRALGQATSLGGQMALPGALHANAPAIVSGVEQAPAAIKGAAQTVGAVTKEAVKGGVKGGLEPTALSTRYGRVSIPVPASVSGGVSGGYAASAMGLPKSAGVVVGAAAPVVRGAVRGARAALADRMVAGLEAQRAAEMATKARATAPTPVGLLGPGITPEAPPDTSYVRSVPAEYPEVQGPPPVQPKGLLGPGPERIITPPAPEDTSYVRSVPAEYPQGEGAPPAAPAAAAAAAPAAIDPGLLEGIAQANFKKPFAKLAAADQQAIRDTAAGFGRKIPEETRGPLPKFREGSESLGEPQPAAQGKTIEQIVQEELAAGKQQQAPVSEQPTGRPDVESKPLETPQGSTEEPESIPNLEPPRSEFLASGERKSSLLRAEEIKAANTTAKAKRYAEALQAYNADAPHALTANQLQLMPKSRWPAVTNDLIIRGLLKPEEVPPNTSIPQIADFLRGIETSANKAKLTPAATVKPGVSAPAPESTQPPAAPSSPLQTPSAGGAEVGQPQTFTGTMADFGRRLNEISKSRDVGALEKTVADMEEYRNSGGPKTDADYKLIGAAIEQGHSTLRQVNRNAVPQSGRPAIESKPVQPSPGSTETSQVQSSPGTTGRAALQGALEKNKGTTAAKKAKLTPKAAAPAEAAATPAAESPVVSAEITPRSIGGKYTVDLRRADGSYVHEAGQGPEFANPDYAKAWIKNYRQSQHGLYDVLPQLQWKPIKSGGYSTTLTVKKPR